MASAAAARRGSLVRWTLRGLGELLITAGVLLGLFIVYELWVTDLFADQSQAQLRTQLARQWRLHPDTLDPPLHLGQGFAILYLPRFGPGYHEVIVQGVAEADLEKGPGHYPGTALPGQIGNFVVSGHRTTYGAPFNQLGELHRGDPIVVETAAAYYTYRVTSSQVVLPTDLAVIAPVPGHPGVRPARAEITLTTCDPEFSASHRLVVHGLLAARRPRLGGPPAVLNPVGG